MCVQNKQKRKTVDMYCLRDADCGTGFRVSYLLLFYYTYQIPMATADNPK